MIASTLFTAILLAAAISDVLTRRIPNWMTGCMALLFVPLAIRSGLPWADLGLHALAGMIALAGGFGLHYLRLLGGGDAKLFAAAALWLGWSSLVPLLVATAIAGGALAFVVLLFERFRSDPRLVFLQPWIGTSRSKAGMPYGVAIAVAGILVAQTGLTLI